MDYLAVVAGLVGLFLGGDALVRGAVGLATRMAIPPLLIGLTVVGFGTSMPELLVSVRAALDGVPDIALGNVVGSNIANILLILGLSALIWPVPVAGRDLRRDIAVMLIAAFAMLPIFALGQIGRPVGLLLVVGLVVYLTLAWRYSDKADQTGAEISAPALVSLLWLAGGLIALILGARFLVQGSVSIARDFGVSEAFIGLTIVAVGTSLPELATSLVAALRRQSEIAIGNILGSNIFNLLAILGVTSIITPVPVAPRFPGFDLPVMIAASVILAGLLLLRPVVARATGAALLTGYAAYIWAAQG